MSQIHHLSGTGLATTVLVAPTLSMLNGMSIQGELQTVSLHDCAAVGDVATGNKVWSLTNDFMVVFSQSFDGAMFMKGMVAVFTGIAEGSTFTANIEWE